MRTAQNLLASLLPNMVIARVTVSMRGCNYTSVATVALHVNNLIKRRHLQKRDRSARSLEVVENDAAKPIYSNQIKVAEENRLVDLIDAKFKGIEKFSKPPLKDVDGLYVLVGALRVLGVDGAAQSFIPRLSALKENYKSPYNKGVFKSKPK
ncbi:MAG: hypothetical protein U0491_01935 [Candidatus Saccharimonadales bacterium]